MSATKAMTEVEVLRSFPVSDDGITIRQMVAGDRGLVPADLVPGLVAEGYVCIALVAARAPAPTPAVVDAPTAAEELPAHETPAATGGVSIPDGWRNLHHKQVVKIAKAIDPTATTLAAATATIESYLGAKG